MDMGYLDVIRSAIHYLRARKGSQDEDEYDGIIVCLGITFAGTITAMLYFELEIQETFKVMEEIFKRIRTSWGRMIVSGQRVSDVF